MLISRDRYPPGGWKFRQPEMNWELSPGRTFKDSVTAIIAKRAANPRFNLSTDRETVANELDAYTCALLKNNPAFCVSGDPPSFRQPLPAKRQPSVGRSGAVVGSSFLKNVGVGIRTWIDFFGSGKTVEKDQAEKRAGVCVTCEFNAKGSILERFSGAAGKEILSIFSTLNELDLRTGLDDKLNVCTQCDCALRAKVWCPIGVFKPHMRKETIDSLPAHCWIVRESQP